MRKYVGGQLQYMREHSPKNDTLMCELEYRLPGDSKVLTPRTFECFVTPPHSVSHEPTNTCVFTQTGTVKSVFDEVTKRHTLLGNFKKRILTSKLQDSSEIKTQHCDTLHALAGGLAGMNRYDT